MITVLFFAELEEVVGNREITLEQSELTVSELKQVLTEKFPNLMLERAMIAVNEEYVEESDVIHSGDTVAFIPPVSGG